MTSNAAFWRRKLGRQAVLPATLRIPAWRWAFVMSAHLFRGINLSSYNRDKLTQKLAGWYRSYMDDEDKDPQETVLNSTAYTLFSTDRPGSLRWIIEALLAAGESPGAVAGRLTGVSPEVIQRYSDVFFDVASLASSKAEMVSTCMCWCTGRECDTVWKLFAVEKGADCFIDMVSTPRMLKENVLWFREVAQKRVAMAAVSGSLGSWDENVERLMTSAGRWLEVSEDDDHASLKQIKVMDFLSQLSVQLRKKSDAGDEREFIPIPFKEEVHVAQGA